MGLLPLDDRAPLAAERPTVSQAEPSHRRLSRAELIRTHVWSPVSLASLLVVPIFILGRQHEWVAHLPIWVLVGSLAIAQFGSLLSGVVWPYPKRPVELWARVGAVQLSIAVCI